MKLVCKQCGEQFSARKCRYQFCGRECRDASMRKVDLDLLQEMVARGDLGKNMAVDLGVSRGRVHRVMKTYGLLEQWRERRYA
jgi:hypothetical protein